MLPLLLLACHRPPGDYDAPCEPAPDRDAATRAALAAGPSVARFSIHIVRGDKAINAQGALLVAPPASLRLEVAGPVGPPQLVVTSNGARVAVWQAGERTLYETDDAPALLARLTGGAIGPEAITAVLLARFPAPGPDTLVAPRHWKVVDGPTVDLGADCAHPDSLAHLVVTDAARGPLFDLQGTTRKGAWDVLSLGLTALDLRVELDFDTWKPATPGPTSFELHAPPGATVVDLASRLALSPAGTTTPAPAPP